MNTVTLPLLAALAAAPPALASQPSAQPCQIDQAQRLMEQQPRPSAQIDALLVQCRAAGSHDYRVDLLAGVLARDEGRLSDAIAALTRSHQQAPGELAPTLELAVTYEFRQRPELARTLYLQVLQSDPESRPARLGMARVARQQYRPTEAEAIYHELLSADPDDQEAQTGLAMAALQQRRYDDARARLETLQAAHPDDPEVQAGLAALAQGWRYRLDLAAGREELAPGHSNRAVAQLEIAANATDAFNIRYEHNDRELASSNPLDPSVLPSNSGRVSWLRRVPGQHFWEVAYEYRQYDIAQDTQRVELNVGHRLGGKVQGFAGLRQQFGATSQHDRLWHVGLSVPTSERTYATLIGYYGQPDAGDDNTAYVANLTWERDRLQLTGGIGYGVDPDNFITHVKGVWPLPHRQAITFAIEHRSLRDETEALLGWRVEWQ